MELKDVILSTLAEMEEDITPAIESELEASSKEKSKNIFFEAPLSEEPPIQNEQEEKYEKSSQGELLYLKSIRERLLVLFEGFQAPNNSNIEAKVDMTLNFLEYTLATIDERLERIEQGDTK